MANPIVIGIQSELFARCGGLLNLIYGEGRADGQAPVSIDPNSQNPIYNGAIGFGMNLCDYPPAMPALIADTDMTFFVSGLYYQMIDLAEYRLIFNAVMNFTDPDETMADRSQSWNGLMNRYQARLKDLEELYKPLLKSSRYSLRFGTIKLPIAPNPNENIYYGI